MLSALLSRRASGSAPRAFSSSAYGVVEGSFEALGVHSSLIGKLGRMGVFKPSAVQAEVLPVVGAKSAPDTVFHAPTGTGKTLAYLLPMLSELTQVPASQRQHAFGMVMVPTRELALQVAAVATALAAQSSRKKRRDAATQIGGALKRKGSMSGGQLEKLLEQAQGSGDWKVGVVKGIVTAGKLAELQRTPPNLLVGTPQALTALVPSLVTAAHLRSVVLDEVDSLLLPHNKPYAAKLMQTVRKVRARRGRAATDPAPLQTVLCGALPTSETRAFASSYLATNWRAVDVGVDGSVASTVRQSLQGRLPAHLQHDVRLAKEGLAAAVVEAVKAKGLCIVFVNDSPTASEIGAALQEAGVSCGVFASGGMSMASKRRLLKRVRQGSLSVLVTTDALSRGVDLPGVSQVVNVHPPPDAPTYLHRAGRAGRLRPVPADQAGSPAAPPAPGTVVTLCDTSKDMAATTQLMHSLGVEPGSAGGELER